MRNKTKPFQITHFSFIHPTVPPDRISIKDESDVDKASVVGPYSEGDIVNLHCEVYGGK